MIDPHTPEIVGTDGPQSSTITDPSSTSEALQDEAGDDCPDRRHRGAKEAPQSISRAMDPSTSERSQGAGEAPVDAALDGRGDAGALLGLEPSTIDKAGQNGGQNEDSNVSASRIPLLGTIFLSDLPKTPCAARGSASPNPPREQSRQGSE